MQHFPPAGGYSWSGPYNSAENLCVPVTCGEASSALVYGLDGQPHRFQVPATESAGACGGAGCAVHTETLPCSPRLACAGGAVCGDDGRCVVPVCGDGVIEAGEACDDRNAADGDGCSATCAIEPGFGCANALNLNTGSDGAGGRLPLGDLDRRWTWAQGDLNASGDADLDLPGGLVWQPAVTIRECVPGWHDAPEGAEWINSTGWNAAERICGMGAASTIGGSVGGVGVTFTSNRGATKRVGPIISHDRSFATAPEYRVPGDMREFVVNSVVTENDLEFARSVSDPLLVFASIGNPNTSVDVVFDQEIELVWTFPTTNFGGGVTYNAATLSADHRTLTGRESFAIVRVRGNHHRVGFNYTVAENACGFLFGFGGDQSDLDANGVYDVCEGAAP